MKRKMLIGACATGGLLLIWLIWLLDFPSWQKLDMEKLTELSQTTVIYDADGQPAADMHGEENRVLVSVEEIPEHVKDAFIAIEDARFYEHPGIDLWRIGGALLSNIKAGGYREGASTITQQLIKLTHLTSEKRLSRKAQEAWLALQLEKKADKDEILGMYLNVVYFGKGAYGIEAASRAYFGKNCGELTLAEGALLAGVIKAPGVYAPHIDMEKAMERRGAVLDAMVREGMIGQEEADKAGREKVQLAEDGGGTASGWYADWVLREAGEALACGIEEVMSGGYRIYTAMESEMQQAAEALFADGRYFPGNAEDGTRPESALIAVNPNQGEIMCMIGGRSYDTRQGLNRAVQIRRQPGSAFKPVSVYAAAVDFLSYTPVSLIEDTARDFGGGYTPSNSSGKEYGTVTLREALTRSMNLASVDLITRTGIDAAKMYAQRAGILLTDQDSNLSLALGALTEGVSPAQMCAAYAPLVNGGRSVETHTIRRIEDLYGRVIYEYSYEPEYVMSGRSARMLTSMLESAVTEGTAQALSGIGFPVAAKTGTVGFSGGGNRDAWTMAVTPTVALAVWQGFDRPDKEHMLPAGTTGGTYPARLAATFLSETEKISNGGGFGMPEGMSEVKLDLYALKRLGNVMLASENTPAQYLINEILPNEQIPALTSNLWNEPARVEAVYVRADEEGYPAVSFVAPDSFAEYRLIREENGVQTEVGCVEGAAGEYVTFADRAEGHDSDALYFIISRHKGFSEIGRQVESAPSGKVLFRAPGLLERLLKQTPPAEEDREKPLFGGE